MATYHLSWLDFLKTPVGQETPLVVLDEIASGHGISNYQSLPLGTKIEAINNTLARTVSLENSNDWRYVARFVNANVGWKLTPLKRAFLNIWSTRVSTKWLSGFRAGLPTPEDPDTIPAIVMYAFCQEKGISCWKDMGYSDLEFFVKSTYMPGYVLISAILEPLSSQAQRGLARRLYKEMCSEHRFSLNERSITRDNLDEAYVAFKSLAGGESAIISRLHLTTTLEAIAVAAIHYRLDISTAASPLEEVYYLQSIDFTSPEEYIPLDAQMSHYKQANPALYCLDLEFNPLFPECYYSSALLEQFMREYGLWGEGTSSSQERYSALCDGCAQDTFYHGYRPEIRNKQSGFDCIDLTEADLDSIVCWGSPNTGFVFFTYDEIQKYFQSKRDFLDPTNSKKRLEQVQITRLRYLASEQLRNVMSAIDMSALQVDEASTKFLTYYREVDEKIQAQINSFLHQLIGLSFMMRGWSGDAPYPVSSAPIGVNYNETCVRVTEEYARLNDALQEIPEITSLILRLPALKFMAPDGYQASIDDVQGRTIGDKLDIVKVGVDYPDTNASCMRVASGWLLSSLYRYMCLIGLEPPFDINELVYVT